jgi:membrane fusion protein (multidrug efflux system)
MAVALTIASLGLPACHLKQHEEGHHEGHQKIVVTSPEARDVVITRPYVCQIHSRRHTEIRALEEGYLEEVHVKEGQAVKQNDVMFKVVPVLYRAKLEAEKAELEYAKVELANTEKLYSQKIVSEQEVKLYKAKVSAKEARVRMAEAELKFTDVKAPFDGIMDRQRQQQGSLVKKEEVLTTLSDNEVMWVYFNVPEARYLEFKAHERKGQSVSQLTLEDAEIQLILANGRRFDQYCGNTITITGNFNNQTGNIAFRADFPNPDRLLRHGQTGTVLIRQTQRNAIVIPQRATFERLDRRYVWVVGEDHTVHQRLITVRNELEDTFVIQSGLDVNDKIVLEGVREVHENDQVEYEFRRPGEALENQKFHAE